MRVAFIVSFVANVILALVSIVVLPARVAIHFGSGGIPNNWAPNYVNSLIFLGMDIILFVCLYFSPHLTFIFPPKSINLPNKQFWLAPENRHRTVAKISALIYQFGVAIFLFLFVIGLLTIQANLTKPVRLKEHYFFLFLIPFLAYSIAWCIVFFKSFRIPNENNLASKQIQPIGGKNAADRLIRNVRSKKYD